MAGLPTLRKSVSTGYDAPADTTPRKRASRLRKVVHRAQVHPGFDTEMVGEPPFLNQTAKATLGVARNSRKGLRARIKM